MPEPTLADVIARLKASVPQLIALARSRDLSDDEAAEVVELETLADQVDLVLSEPAERPAAGIAPGTPPPPIV